MLSDDDCPSSPDGFYEKEQSTNLWLPFIHPDQYMFRRYLECQSSPVTSGADISTIYQNPADSTFSEGTWRNLLNHCDNSTSHFLVSSGVSNKIWCQRKIRWNHYSTKTFSDATRIQLSCAASHLREEGISDWRRLSNPETISWWHKTCNEGHLINIFGFNMTAWLKTYFKLHLWAVVHCSPLNHQHYKVFEVRRLPIWSLLLTLTQERCGVKSTPHQPLYNKRLCLILRRATKEILDPYNISSPMARQFGSSLKWVRKQLITSNSVPETFQLVNTPCRVHF